MMGSLVRRVMVSGLVMMMMLSRLVGGVRGENCGCKEGLCCSKYGFCGSGDEYCGKGCKEGACYGTGTGNHVSVSVSDIVTSEFFDGIMDEAEEHCPGKNFYSRNAFLDALLAYDQFAITPSVDDSKREIAAAFAHFTHQTTHFCYIEEIDGASKDYCNKSFSQYPCAHDKSYYGRGPIQLSWNFNYGPAGDNNGFDGLNAPETVASDPVISFKTALWYWTQYISPLMKNGFGETIRAINGKLECDGANPQNVQARVSYYTQYCSLLGVAPGDNLTC